MTAPNAPERPVLLIWQGTGDALASHPDPGPHKDWAMITRLVAWEAGHGRHAKVRFDPASQSIICEPCSAVLFEVAPVRPVAA